MRKSLALVLGLVLLMTLCVVTSRSIFASSLDSWLREKKANVTVQSPENRTYNENNVTLGFTIETGVTPIENFSWKVIYEFFVHGVALDYNTSNLVKIAPSAAYIGGVPDNVSISLSSLGNNVYVGNATLTNLSQGAHNLTVWVSVYQYMLSYDNYGGSAFSTASFYIDSIPPNITILSPETKPYNTSDVPLDFTVNEAFSQVSYSLDGQENITVNGNMTLARLFYGAHNVTVYATDEAGNVGASETITFTIAEPFPVVPVAVTVTVAVAVGAGLLVYFKKHKH